MTKQCLSFLHLIAEMPLSKAVNAKLLSEALQSPTNQTVGFTEQLPSINMFIVHGKMYLSTQR